jgi:ABC-type sugar transport system substrate-binding protein
MKKKMLILLACVLMLAVPMALMAGGQTEEAGSGSSEGPMTIGVALDNLNDPFWLGIKKGVEDAGKDLGVDLVIRTAEADAVKQNSQIDDMIAQGVDGIACVYVDSKSILQAIKACNAAGIPFVYCDRTVASTADAKVGWGIATDNYALTVNGWKWMADYARENKMQLKVLELVGSLSDENVLRRTDGFEKVMADNSDIIERVQQVPTEWNLEKALAGATNALQANPEINCIFMHSDYLLGATISALRQAGRYKKIGEEGHVAVMPYSGNEASLNAMREGYVEMCFGMDVYKTGYDAVKAAVELAQGKSYGEPVSDAGFIITQDNFAETSKRAYGSF